MKLISRWKHEELHNLVVEGCTDFGLDEAQLTNSSQHQQITPQSITETSRWTSNPLDSVPLYSKMYFYLKRAARLLRNSPGKTLLTVFLVEEWVDIWMKSIQ